MVARKNVIKNDEKGTVMYNLTGIGITRDDDSTGIGIQATSAGIRHS
jgi:hypothetical protein